MADEKKAIDKEKISKMQNEVVALFKELNATPQEIARICRKIIEIQLDLKKE